MEGVYLVQPDMLLNTNKYKFGMSKEVDKRVKNYGSNGKILAKYRCKYSLLHEKKLKYIYKNMVFVRNEYIQHDDENILIYLFYKCVASTATIIKFIKKYILNKIKKEKRQLKLIHSQENNLVNNSNNYKEHSSKISTNNSTIFKYSCPRCNYSTNSSQSYIRHIKRVNICDGTKSNISLEIEYKNHIEIRKKALEKSKDNQTFICDLCNKKLSSRQSLDNHTTKCKVKKRRKSKDKNITASNEINNKQLSEIMDKQIEELKEQVKKLEEQIKNNNTKTTDTSIDIMSYDRTKLDVLSNKEILKCMKYNANCVPALIELLHCNKERPEYMNIYIEYYNTEYIKIYDGNNWIIRIMDDVIHDIIEICNYFIYQKIQEWKDKKKYTPEINKFSKYMDASEDERYSVRIKQNVVIKLFNNKHNINKLITN